MAHDVEVAGVPVDGRIVNGVRAGEEYRGIVLAGLRGVVGEDAGEGERQEVFAQQAVGVHGCAPGLAHATAGGQVARVQTTKDIRSQVVG